MTIYMVKFEMFTIRNILEAKKFMTISFNLFTFNIYKSQDLTFK